jgi:hypothetical protein
MNTENARQIATPIVAKMTDQIPAELKTFSGPPPHSLKNILEVGLIVTHNLREFAQSSSDGAFPIKPELIAALACINSNLIVSSAL